MPKSPVNAPVACVVVTTTVGTASHAESLAALLLDRRLAACISYTTVAARYVWNGAVVAADEVQVTIKSLPHCVDALVDAVTSWHPYDTPEILVTLSSTTERYGTWLATAVYADGHPLP